MKRRIIAMLLVVVMSVLALASCGYSYAKDDMKKYAAFGAEEKAKFIEALKSLIIEDGEFTDDEGTRALRVIDNINETLANHADKDDHKKDDKYDSNDIIYYNYYYQWIDEKDNTNPTAIPRPTGASKGVHQYDTTDTMKDKPASIQMGLSHYDNVVAEEIEKKLAAKEELKFDYEYDTSTLAKNEDGTTKKDEAGNAVPNNVKGGDLVSVTYTYTYEGLTTPVKHTAQFIVIEECEKNEDAKTLAAYLCGEKNNDKISKIEITGEDGKLVTFTDVTINYIVKASDAIVVDVTTDEEKKDLKDTSGATDSIVKGTKLTYYVFPAYYVAVDNYDATNLINVILGENIVYDAIVEILFGEEYINEDTKEEKAAELAELVKAFETTDADGKTKTLEAFVKEIADAQKAIASAEDELEHAEEDLSEANEDLADAEEDLSENPTGEAEKKAVEDAKKIVTTKEGDKTAAEEKVNTKKRERDALVAKFLALPDMSAKLIRGYQIATYNYLQDLYNEEIKTKLATAIYAAINENVTVTSLPKDAVELTYKQLIENHETEFYTGTDSDSKTSNYKKHAGSFDNYLKAVMGNVDSVKLAKDAVKKEAEEMNQPIVRLYRLAEEFGVLVTDSEFKKYKKENKIAYDNAAGTYGANSVRHAYQFDKLMDYFLESTEEKAAATDEGYVFVKIVYNAERIAFTAEDESKAEESAE